MLFSKSIVALTFAAFALANPIKRADEEPLTCYFIMTPSPELGAAELQTSINYAVGHTLGVHYPNTLLKADNDPLVRHNDGTFDVLSRITVEGVSQEDIAAFVNSWDETTLQGFNNEWHVNAAYCSLKPKN